MEIETSGRDRSEALPQRPVRGQPAQLVRARPLNVLWVIDHVCYDGSLHGGGRLFHDLIPLRRRKGQIAARLAEQYSVEASARRFADIYQRLSRRPSAAALATAG